MSDFGNFTQALLGAVNTTSNVVNDYTTNQAKLSTQSKQIKLQADINNELMKIQQSSDYNNWQQNMNDFFERVKNGMSDKNSQYYCANNLQAQMFTSILEENQVGISQKVNQMVYSKQKDSAIVDYTNNLALLAQQYSGQDYINKANEGAKMLYDLGYIDENQYQQQLDSNYTTAYSDIYINTFNESLNDGLSQNKSFEALYADMQQNMPEMIATDTSGLPKTVDKEALDKSIKKTLQQNYTAALNDIQQGNANRLSEIEQRMRQANTAEGKVAIARQGQNAMNGMMGLQLSETDRHKYAVIFEIELEGGLGGSGSGSGSGGSKVTDSFETLIKASPDTAIQLWLDGKNGNMYDITQVVSDNLVNEWFTGNYKENYGKDYSERNEEYETIYRGKTSSDSITDAIMKKLAEKFPTAKNYIDNNFSKLVKDIQNNPKQYGEATVGNLSNFILDWLGESTSDMTDEDFVKAFQKHVNDCYVESCKYMELNKKGELVKKYDATNAKDIASAAKMAHEKDYVYTYNGEEVWAAGKKEALEAKGGIVDVMKNAVAGTLGIDDTSSLDFYYQRSKDDMQSLPIITYKGQSYEVDSTADGKGFVVKNLTTGEVMNGVIPNKAGERKAAKEEAKAEAKAASQATATVIKERRDKVQKSLTETKQTPKAVEITNVIPDEEKAWKWESSTNEEKEKILNMANTKIQNDADKVKATLDGKAKKKNQMSKADFNKKYGIDYDEWIESNEINYRYGLILGIK